MPDINPNSPEYDEIIDFLRDSFEITVSREKEERAKKEYEDYLKKKKKDISELSPLTLYYIIKDLSSKEQIEFIRKNIDYIRKNDEDIFLYNMLAPSSLSYSLSYEVIKEIYKLDKNIFEKMITGSFENFINDFSSQNFISLYDDFYKEINSLENDKFISNLYIILSHHQHQIAKDLFDSKKDNKKGKEALNNFIFFIVDKYEQKISSFSPEETFKFLTFVSNSSLEISEKYTKMNKEKLCEFFKKTDANYLRKHFSNASENEMKIIFSSLEKELFTYHSIKDFYDSIPSKILIDLYEKDKESVKDLNLKDWLIISCQYTSFNDKSKKILDDFEIDSIEDLFLTGYLYNTLPLRYIEKKFREQLPVKEQLNEINDKTSPFSNDFLQNLNILQILLKKEIISRNDPSYKSHLKVIMNYFESKNIIIERNETNYREIEKLFYRIVMGASLTTIKRVSNVEEIACLNRLGKKEFNTSYFSVNQIVNHNVKNHKKLYSKFSKSDIYLYDYKTLTLKLMLMVGYTNAKYILELDDNLTTLEHLVGNVDIKKIQLDEEGNPILNTKLMNLLFKDKDRDRIKKMLENKESILYKYFPRIFNEWDVIVLNGKEKTLSSVIEFLESDDVKLAPKYYRLDGQFKHIGCNNNIVNETLKIHDKILERTSSSIPRIKGSLGDYNYEILKLQDFSGISIGNMTNCCFTVLGQSHSSLTHALTNKNGRILRITKDGNLIAHSWLWRNGNVLCFDNLETAKAINSIDFFDVYLKIADEIIQTSRVYEGKDSCVKNVTIGYTSFDKPVNGIEKFPYFITNACLLSKKDFLSRLSSNKIILDELPQPSESPIYSDAKNVQYLIKGKGDFKFYEARDCYRDIRKSVLYYSRENYDEETERKIEQVINSLRYVKHELESNKDIYKMIYMHDLKEVYCNEDWYIFIDKKGNIESFIYSNDDRAKQEFDNVLETKIRRHISKK